MLQRIQAYGDPFSVNLPMLENFAKSLAGVSQGQLYHSRITGVTVEDAIS